MASKGKRKSSTEKMQREASAYEGRIGVREGAVQLSAQTNRPYVYNTRFARRPAAQFGSDLRPETRGNEYERKGG